MMTNEELEQVIIDCLKDNFELSGESVPPITRYTKPALELGGFDSLRTIEVIVTLEDKLECDLPPEKIFENTKLENISIEGIAQAIGEIIKAKKK